VIEQVVFVWIFFENFALLMMMMMMMMMKKLVLYKTNGDCPVVYNHLGRDLRPNHMLITKDQMLEFFFQYEIQSMLMNKYEHNSTQFQKKVEKIGVEGQSRMLRFFCLKSDTNFSL
jgi:hypothetical protein